MKKLFLFPITFLFIFVYSCQKSPKNITQVADYDTFLEFSDYSKELNTLEKEIGFWSNKIEKADNQPPYYLKLAAAQNALFGLTANVENLNSAAKNIEKANQQVSNGQSGSLRTLAHTYISQHRFQEAKNCLLIADSLGADKKATEKMMFDVNMEIGNVEAARSFLIKNASSSDFDILIRQAKFFDYEGNIEKAIATMETAKKEAEKQNNTSLKEWIYTNLADYYGHNGQIKESYTHYLKALKINNNSTYALKGIAWIAFSHEKNTGEALRIIAKLEKVHPSPDYILLKSQIYLFLGDSTKATDYQNEFLKLAQDIRYGDMYNAYVVPLTNKESAFKIAQKEIANRPLPASYDLLALALLKNNRAQEALIMINQKVAGKTSEPMSLYHQAEIHKAVGNKKEAKNLKMLLKEAYFELGPVMAGKIEKI